jgi:subtilisin family serine protease
MKKFGSVLLLAFIVSLWPSAGQMQKDQAAARGAFVPGELLVKFKDLANAPTAHAAVGANVLQTFPDLEWQHIRLPAGLPVAEAENIYRQLPGVVAAQPNYSFYRLLNTPNDPRFGEMFGMTRIGAPAAWDTTTGNQNMVVAVIDTGARYTHEDLSPNIWRNPGEIQNNGLDDDNNGFIDDYFGYDFFFNDPDPLDENGHGTHTGGTVGAKGNNGLGVTGVNWNVTVMPIKIYNSTGFGSTSVMLVNAYNYVRLMKNRGVDIRVTSNSYGGCDEACGYDQATKDALDALGHAGVLNVFAAGNNGSNLDANPPASLFFPAGYDSPTLLSIGSSTSADSISGFSNFGAVSVDLFAPGSSILSTTNGSNSSYGLNSGTSMACPHAAGAAALLAAAHPHLSALSLKASLMNNVDAVPAMAGRAVTGGRLNVARAIQNPTLCAYNLGSNGQTVGSAGGNLSVNVASPANCGWEAISNANWITVGAGRVGAGNGTVTLAVAANPGAERTGTATIAGQTFTVTQSSGAPSISINDVSVAEGNSGATQANFTVTLSAASAQRVVVTYKTADGSATAGADYVAVEADLAFNPGQTSQQVSVTIIGDTFFEPNETFFVNLSDPANATLGDGQGQGAILNDDPAPSVVSLSAATYTANESAGAVAVTVNRSGNTALPGSVKYRTNNTNLIPTPPPPCSDPNSIRARCDYVPTFGTLTFAAGETSKQIVIPVVDDLFTETDETFAFLLFDAGPNTLLSFPNQATITLVDNDATQPANRTFVAQLTGAQEVPANNSTANGSGTVTLNEAETQIAVNLTFNGLSSAQTAAHIHAAAHVGVNAPVLFNLGTGPISNATFNVTPNQAQQLKKGLMYFNVHTQNFNGGEIRGQILANPLESARFFVQQQYHEFLSRAPDQAGWDFWTNQIVQVCGADLTCLHNRRIEVSAAFFVEQEFQESGAYVFRLYKAAFGEQPDYRPDYDLFVPDRAAVVGGPDLAAGKLAFANDFAQRPLFTARYPESLTPAQFVDAILATVLPGSGVSFTAAERQNFINDATNNGRGTMLRNLGDNAAFRAALFNRGFVLMQYFGYLKRNPDQTGYDFWLNLLNQQPSNARGMVCAFITSDEYQQRFSLISARSNQDCGP